MKSNGDTNNGESSVYIGEKSKHYGAKVKINGKELECLSKKQINVLYPRKNYMVVAEYASESSNNSEGLLKYKNLELKLSKYKAHNRLSYQEKGFVSVGEDSFVVFLKNILITRVIAAVLCLGLVAAGVAAAVLLSNENSIVNAPDEETALYGQEDQPQPDLEEGAVDWEGAKPRETGGVTNGIAIPGYKSITIDAGKTDIKVNLQNPEGNPCYFVISLILEDGTAIYKSKMIEPGKGLYDITISQPLAKGEYPAVVKYETFSLEGLNPLNGAEVKIILIAE